MSKGVIAAVIIGVLVVVGGGVTAAILLLGGDDEGGGGGALETAQAYVDAIRDGDCTAAQDLSTDDMNQDIDCEQDIMPPEDYDVEIGDPEITDESDSEATATVAVTISDGSEDSTIDLSFGLVNESGEWLVNSFGDEGSSSGPTDAPASMPSLSVPTSIPSFSIPSFSVPTG